MTKDDKIKYIDEDTYYVISGRKDKKEYLEFLNNNPTFVDVKMKKLNTTLKQDLEKTETIKKESLEEKHKQADDLRYIPYLIWLEQYLGRYELVYGKFNYSKENITNKQKCEELLGYYSNVCGITDIEQIFKRKPHRAFYQGRHR